MFKLDSEEALLKAFRSKDRKLVEVTPEVRFGVPIRDYLAWSHPAGGRVYVVFAVKGGVPTGLVFDTNGGSGEAIPQMCEWCHSHGLGSQVALLTVRTTGHKRVGVHLCSDLSCKKKLEEEADRSGRSALPAVDALLERMARFAREALHVDPMGGDR